MRVEARRTGVIIPWPSAANRTSRPAPGPEEPRGEIRFFTGVRYERMGERSPEPSPRAAGQGRRARRRS